METNCLAVQHSKRLIYIPGGCLTPESSEIFKFQVDPLKLPKEVCLSTIQLKSTQLRMRPRTFPRCGIWGAKIPNCSGETRMSWSCQLIELGSKVVWGLL